MKKTVIFLVVIFAGLMTNTAKSQDAKTILAKVDQVTSTANDVSEDLVITLIDKNNRKQERKAVLMQKGDDKRLFKFTSPAAQKGIAFLSLPNDVMYVYMPAYGKERRIASSVKNQKFAGTDMTYDDLQAKNYSDEYTPELVSFDGQFYVLKLTPKGKSQYSKLVLKVKKADYTPVSLSYFDKGGRKVKLSEMEFVKSGKYYYPKVLTVTDLRTKHKTVMRTENVKFDTGLSDDIFTVRNLKNN